jgi:2-polyprenyl-3-methyl-5-hydroxy-6-metoxy-1,4-benzoquinol methylase
MKSSEQNVAEETARGNLWYTGSQFEWAARPDMRPIYEKRNAFFRQCIERARTRFGEPLRFLDAGCGDGYWLKRLGDIPGLELSGFDYNPLRIERARSNAPHARIEQAELSALEALPGYHVVLLSQVIEHVRDDTALLKKIRQLLCDGGTLIVGTPNEGCFLQQWKMRRAGMLATTDHVHFYKEREIRGRLASAGFRVERTMREVFYTGFDSVQGYLLMRAWGVRWLEIMTAIFPSQCTDYYFECVVQSGT